MKKAIIAALIIMTSCSNPEDRATGNTDSTRYNAKENETPNSGTDFNKPVTATGDTSKAATLDQKNANSPTQGTNRPYGTKDSTK